MAAKTSPRKYKAPGKKKTVADAPGHLGWEVDKRPFRRVRGIELSVIARAVRQVPYETPVSSPAGQIQTIAKYARGMGCAIQSIADHEGPKDEEGNPLNRIWIKKNPNGEAIPDLT